MSFSKPDVVFILYSSSSTALFRIPVFIILKLFLHVLVLRYLIFFPVLFILPMEIFSFLFFSSFAFIIYPFLCLSSSFSFTISYSIPLCSFRSSSVPSLIFILRFLVPFPGFYRLLYSCRLGGVMFNVLVIGPKVRRFKPGRRRWTFKGDKNQRQTFLRRGSKAVGPMS
jgi:hypothetical protein